MDPLQPTKRAEYTGLEVPLGGQVGDMLPATRG
jgi:hypothetical protein